MEQYGNADVQQRRPPNEHDGKAAGADYEDEKEPRNPTGAPESKRRESPHGTSEDKTLVRTLPHQRTDEDRRDECGVSDDGVGRPDPHSSHHRQPTERAE